MNIKLIHLTNIQNVKMFLNLKFSNMMRCIPFNIPAEAAGKMPVHKQIKDGFLNTFCAFKHIPRY